MVDCVQAILVNLQKKCSNDQRLTTEEQTRIRLRALSFSRILTLDDQGVSPELVLHAPARVDLAVVPREGQLAGAFLDELGAEVAGHGEAVPQALVQVQAEWMASRAKNLASGRGDEERLKHHSITNPLLEG